MAASFFGKGIDSSDLFQKLKIAGSDHYREHLNQHNVIYIDFSEIPRKCQDYQQYIQRIEEGIIRDLLETYPEVRNDAEEAVWDILTRIFEKTGQTFIFVMDEWDAVFHMPFITGEGQEQYLLFLKALLKSKAYVELAYMTGILPIAKYSGGSELNMFLEYNIATKKRFSEYFGFLDQEVDQLSSYWTDSGPYDEIYYYIKDNVADVREDLVWMIYVEGYACRRREDDGRNFKICP